MVKVWAYVLLAILALLGLEHFGIVEAFSKSNEARELVAGAILILVLGIIVFSRDPLFIGLAVLLIMKQAIYSKTTADDELEVENTAWGIFQP